MEIKYRKKPYVLLYTPSVLVTSKTNHVPSLVIPLVVHLISYFDIFVYLALSLSLVSFISSFDCTFYEQNTYILPSSELWNYTSTFLLFILSLTWYQLSIMLTSSMGFQILSLYFSKFENMMTCLVGITHHKMTVSLSSSDPYLLHLLTQIVTLFFSGKVRMGQKGPYGLQHFSSLVFFYLTHRH